MIVKRTRIKICGVRDPETACAAADAGADAIGLVFVDRSPRCVTVEQGRDIVKAVPAFVEPVALFMNADTSLVRQTASRLGLGTIQLHGGEPPELAAQLAPLWVIKAISFDTESFAERIRAWPGPCGNLAGVLLDTPPMSPAGAATLPGGGGKAFEWAALAEWLQRQTWPSMAPMVLAGGLTPDNVCRAIETVRPYAVDVSSGVESAPGVKDKVRINAFCQAVRDADRQREV